MMEAEHFFLDALKPVVIYKHLLIFFFSEEGVSTGLTWPDSHCPMRKTGREVGELENTMV